MKQNSRKAWLLETHTCIYQENSLWTWNKETDWSWQEMSNSLCLIHSSATHRQLWRQGSRRLCWYRVSQTFYFHADSRIPKQRLLVLKNDNPYVFINILCLWEMLGRLTFISTSLSDLTDHHFVHFLVYAHIVNPCSRLLYLHLALYSWAIFSGFRLPPDILTSLNITLFWKRIPTILWSYFFCYCFFFFHYHYIVLTKSYWLHIPLFQTSSDSYSWWAQMVLHDNTRRQR